MSESGGSASPDKLMVLIGMVSMAYGSYLTLQSDDTDELQKAVQAHARQIAVLEYKIDVLLEREAGNDQR